MKRMYALLTFLLILSGLTSCGGTTELGKSSKSNTNTSGLTQNEETTKNKGLASRGFHNGVDYYSYEPFIACVDHNLCDGWDLDYVSRLTGAIADAKTSLRLKKKNIVIEVKNPDGSIAIREQRVTNDNGEFSSSVYYLARGYDFSLCVRDSDLRMDGLTLFVSHYSGNEACYRGTIPQYTHTHVFGFFAKGVEATLDIAELIKTGSYCAPGKTIITSDYADISIPFLGLLGNCRKLDSRVTGGIAGGGAWLEDATVTTTFDVDSSDPVVVVSKSDSKGIFVTPKVSRVRGKAATVCATKVGYEPGCTRITLSNDLDTYMNLILVKNAPPSGSVKIVNNGQNDAKLVGYAVDPESNGPLSIRVTYPGGSKDFTTGTQNEEACTAGNCTGGFEIPLCALGLTQAQSSITVSVRNPPLGTNPNWVQYILLSGSPVNANFSTPSGRWVSAMFQEILKRQATFDEAHHYANAYDAGTMSRTQVAKALFESEEYYQGKVREFYLHFLQREPDYGGLLYWIERFKVIGQDKIIAGFMESPEYYEKGGSTPAGWVTFLYKDILGREPDAGGLKYWIEKLQSGASRSEISFGFITSDEYRTNYLIKPWYQQYLGREADYGGLIYWLGQMRQGRSREDIQVGFAASEEFYRLKSAPQCSK